MKLHEYATIVRSKNAGAFMITIDIMFDSMDKYEHVRSSGVLTRTLVARLCGVNEAEVEYYECPEALALKFSYPRNISVGAFTERDLFGCQYAAPLVEVEIDE